MILCRDWERVNFDDSFVFAQPKARLQMAQLPTQGIDNIVAVRVDEATKASAVSTIRRRINESSGRRRRHLRDTNGANNIVTECSDQFWGLPRTSLLSLPSFSSKTESKEGSIRESATKRPAKERAATPKHSTQTQTRTSAADLRSDDILAEDQQMIVAGAKTHCGVAVGTESAPTTDIKSSKTEAIVPVSAGSRSSERLVARHASTATPTVGPAHAFDAPNMHSDKTHTCAAARRCQPSPAPRTFLKPDTSSSEQPAKCVSIASRGSLARECAPNKASTAAADVMDAARAASRAKLLTAAYD